MLSGRGPSAESRGSHCASPIPGVSTDASAQGPDIRFQHALLSADRWLGAAQPGRGRNATAAGWPPRPGGFTLTLDVLVPTVAFPLLALALLCLTRPCRTTILVTRSRVSGLVR